MRSIFKTILRYKTQKSISNSERILNNIIPSIAAKQGFVNYESKINTISSEGANFQTTLHAININEGEKKLDLFAKIAATGKALRAQGPRVYETEIFAYKELLKKYENLENEHLVAKEHRLSVPAFYGSHDKEFEETIVLENLLTSGYQSFNRFKSVDWEYAKAAISQLGKLHALSFAYNKYHEKDFLKTVEERKIKWNLDDQWEHLYSKMFSKAVSVTRGNNKEKLERYYKNFHKDTFEGYYVPKRRTALIHGNYKHSNLMHRIRNDGTVDIKIVDLQTLQGASPVVDLLYFIFTGSDEAFRAQYYDKLIDHYYSELEAAMLRLHLNPEKVYSRADFEYELEEKLPFGLTIAVFALPVVTVDVEYAPKVNEDMDMSAFSVEKTSDLFTERLNGVVNDYVKWGILK